MTQDTHDKGAQAAAPPLFRDEAMARFRVTAWQPPLLSRPLPGYVLAAFSLVAGTALLAFAGTFEFARKEQVAGYLTPADGWARVSAKSFGVVRQRFVAPGEAVASGQPLLELSPGDGLREAVTVQERMLEEIDGRRAALGARLRLANAEHGHERDLLQRQDEADRSELGRLEEEIQISAGRMQIARQRFRDGLKLLATGAITKTDLAQLEEELQARRLALSERRRQAQRLRSVLQSQATRLAQLAANRDLKQAVIAEQLHTLAMEESRLRNEGAAQVLAPRGGVVASVRVRVGDGVRPGQSLLDIVPADQALRARLLVPPAAMGFVVPGQDVRIYLDAFPYQHHGAQAGRVASISQTAMAPDETLAISGAGAPSYRVDVEFHNGFSLPEAQLAALRPGMTLTADIVRDYRTLIDWLLEPLQGAAARL